MGFVSFSNSALSFKSELISANHENKNKLLDYIDKISIFGQTNFEDAFKEAFNIFNTTAKISEIEC